MTKYEKYWTAMRKYYSAKAKFYREHGDDFFASLYEQDAKDASYMIDHPNEYSDELEFSWNENERMRMERMIKDEP